MAQSYDDYLTPLELLHLEGPYIVVEATYHGDGKFLVYISEELGGIVGGIVSVGLWAGVYANWPEVILDDSVSQRGYKPGSRMPLHRLIIATLFDVDKEWVKSYIMRKDKALDGCFANATMENMLVRLKGEKGYTSVRTIYDTAKTHGLPALRDAELTSRILSKAAGRERIARAERYECSEHAPAKVKKCLDCGLVFRYCPKHDAIITYHHPKFCQCWLD